MNLWKSIIVLMELVCLGLALRTNGYHQKYRLTRRDGEVAQAQADEKQDLDVSETKPVEKGVTTYYYYYPVEAVPLEPYENPINALKRQDNGTAATKANGYKAPVKHPNYDLPISFVIVMFVFAVILAGIVVSYQYANNGRSFTSDFQNRIDDVTQDVYNAIYNLDFNKLK